MEISGSPTEKAILAWAVKVLLLPETYYLLLACISISS